MEEKINTEKEWLLSFKANLNEDKKGLKNVEDQLQALKSTEAEKLVEYENVSKKMESFKEKMSERTKSMTAASQDLKNKE